MFSVNDKRDMNNGFGDAMSRAVEFVLTPLVFGALGFLLDRWLGTTPLFAVGLALLAVVGMFLRVWYGYDLEMRRHESATRWGRDRAEAPAAPPVADLWSAARDDRETSA